MKRKIIFILFAMLIANINGQKIKFAGIVVDDKLNPIEGASVIITTLDKKHITYSITNKIGHYNLNFKSVDKNFFIKISHIAYENIIENVVDNGKDNNYKLVKKLFNFDEIIIKAKKIKDTMKIKTDSLVLTERSTLRNILDKTEGFNVSKNGGITFRGKKINKILINKKEVFVNQNKIALDNLEFEIMNDLELINNYKDKFDVDFNNFTSSVININTKKEFNGILKLYGDGAYGYKDKYYIKLRSFYF